MINNIEELEKQLEECKELMYSNEVSAEERKMYIELYTTLTQQISEIKKDERNEKFNLIKIGLEIATLMWSIGSFISTQKWKTKMMVGFTAWEKENSITSSFGKDMIKNIQKF